MSVVKLEFDPKNMPFRRLGPSGLRVPVFSLGGCTAWYGLCLDNLLTGTFFPHTGLTLGGTVTGDPVKVRHPAVVRS